LEVLETSKPTEPKPKPKPKKTKRVLKPRIRKPKVWDQLEAVRTLTDEELEEAIMSGDIRFDEDEI
jgi:hypothetical protein